jgi:hypothetical protein
MAMTEQEWLACSDPQKMLELLSGKASERRLRLLACAFCHGLWDRLGDSDRDLVEVVERFVEHQASEQDLAAARERVMNTLPFAPRARAHVWAAAQATTSTRGFSGIARLLAEIGNTLRTHWNQPADSDMVRMTSAVAFLPFHVLEGTINHFGWLPETSPQQPLLIRDIVGNPFRPVTINPAWRTSNVTALAQAIYVDRAFDRLPILADALEDTGCDNADILNHCRQSGVHFRGCWVVDLLLDKE